MTAPSRRNAGVFLATTALVAAALVATPIAAQADTAPTGVDLSQYELVGRYELPEPTRTQAPAGSLLAQEASSVTYDWDTGTLFVVGDGGTSVVQVTKTGQLIDSETLAAGTSPQGTEFYDTEAISYVGNGQFVLGEERYQQVNLFTYQAGATLTRDQVKTVKLGATIGNTGIEGFAYDPSASTGSALGFVGVKEIDPKGIFQTDVDFAAGTATNANTSGEPSNLFDPTLVATDDFSDVYPLSNQPALDGTAQASDLLIISQQSGKIVDVDRAGNTRSSLTITDAGAPLSVPDETHEGITMDRDGNIYTVNENGGGDASHPQLWVYSPNPVAAPRVAVTEVDPAGSSAAYGADWFELTNTGSTDLDLTGWKTDDSSNAFGSAVPLAGLATLPAGKSAVFLENDSQSDATDASLLAAFSTAWFGSATPPAGFLHGFYGGSGVGLSTGGDAVNLFDGAGNHVTGVSFGAAPAGGATLDNSARLGATAAPVAISRASADAVFGAFVSAGGETGSPDGLAPTGGGTTPPPSGGSVVVTEVSPWGSGNAPYAADWFELTNTGTTAVDLTGWKMDDSSASFGSAVPLLGVTSLPAGRSVVFFEDTSGTDATIEAAFAQAWFSKNTFPEGFLVGHYGGSGVGLSTGGDAVAVFDGTGALVTGVSFGASPSSAPFATFDNATGAGSASLPLPVISTLSAVGTNGAILAADGAEIGSPGTAAVAAPPAPLPSIAVTEISPWGSGNAPYAADWFELTNTGTTAIDLTGWKMDDSSAALTTAVPLAGVASLPVGASAVFFEDTSGTDATIEATFAQAWFGSSTLPAGFLVGHYGGSGVGLSTGGDAVAIFDGTGRLVTGVSFGASPAAAPFATFDNTAAAGSSTLPLPVVTTLSAAGVHGAFLAADGAELGSPAGVAAPVLDRTAPTVTFSGNKGSYGILDQVDITSAATDDTGVVSSSLPSAVGPAWSFDAGAHTLTATATDAAGNTGQASATFTVTVAAGDLSKLTTRWVQGSTKYTSSGPLVKIVATVLVATVSSALLAFNPKANAAAKAARVKAYDAAVRALASAGWLASSQAATLTGLAAAL